MPQGLKELTESIMAELERRLQDFRNGKVTGISAEEAFRRIKETLKSHSLTSIDGKNTVRVRASTDAIVWRDNSS